MNVAGPITDSRSGAPRRASSQAQVAAVFAMRMAASHGLNTYLVWLAFTSKSAAAAGWVLAARALASLVVPLTVGHVHDRGSIGPWLKACAVVEAITAITLAWVGWHGAASWAMVGLSLVLGITSAMFDTVVYPLILASRPSRLRSHVLVGLAYDVAKVVGSSAVLALLAVWDSPWPVMVVCLLALAGWRLRAPDLRGATTHGESPWRVMDIAPVVAIAVASLLPGQMSVFQVVAAHHSFWRYAVLGTLFALGAVTGNMLMQRIDVSRRNASTAYVATGAGLLLMLVAPEAGMFAYGVAVAVYWQLTRVLVIEMAPEAARGRVSAAMIAASRTVAVGGSLLSAALVHRPGVLYVSSAAVAALCAVAVTWQRRTAASPALG